MALDTLKFGILEDELKLAHESEDLGVLITISYRTTGEDGAAAVQITILSGRPDSPEDYVKALLALFPKGPAPD